MNYYNCDIIIGNPSLKFGRCCMWTVTTGYKEKERKGNKPTGINSLNNKWGLWGSYFALHMIYGINTFYTLSCICNATLVCNLRLPAMYCIRVPSTGWVTEAVP